MTDRSIPKAFLDEVKQALENLYDFPFLQKHSLTRAIPAETLKAGESVGQHLRRNLIEAIETLNPGGNVFFRSPHARLYNLMQLHYVEAMTIQEAAHELGISARQAYRDLRRGQSNVALVLWEQYSEKDTTAAPPTLDDMPSLHESQLTTMESELARVHADLREVNLGELLRTAHKAIDRLAQQQGKQIHVVLPTQTCLIQSNPVLAQQFMVNLLSHTVQNAAAPHITSQLVIQGEHIYWEILCENLADYPTHQLIPPILDDLIPLLGWQVLVDDAGCYIQILFPTLGQQMTVLIVDDNQGLVELLERYLSGHHCQVISALSGAEGLKLALQMLPEVIILDVMMPEMDGWELLQRLRALPSFEQIPIIVCSVFNDPELAYSLGATLFIPKPVSRDAILSALQQLQVI